MEMKTRFNAIMLAAAVAGACILFAGCAKDSRKGEPTKVFKELQAALAKDDFDAAAQYVSDPVKPMLQMIPKGMKKAITSAKVKKEVFDEEGAIITVKYKDDQKNTQTRTFRFKYIEDKWVFSGL